MALVGCRCQQVLLITISGLVLQGVNFEREVLENCLLSLPPSKIAYIDNSKPFIYSKLREGGTPFIVPSYIKTFGSRSIELFQRKRRS